MSSQSFVERFGRGSSPMATRSCRSCRAGRSRAGSGAALVRLSRLDPPCRAADHRARVRRLVDLARRRRRHRLRAGRRCRHRHQRRGAALEPERLSARLATRRRSGIGRAPKRLLVYRASAPFAGIRRAPIEVLGLGQQFVAHAIHPTPVGPTSGRRSASPTSTSATCRSSTRARCARSSTRRSRWCRPPEAGAPRRIAIGRRGPPHSQAGTLAAIREALAWIPNADLDYDSWVRIGLALKGALGDAGADLFRPLVGAVGQGRSGVHREDVGGAKAERIRDDLPPAMGHGWRPDPALVLTGPRRSTRCIRQPACRQRAAAGHSICASDAAAVRPARPDGIWDMVDYMVRPPAAQPLLSLGASLCALRCRWGEVPPRPTCAPTSPSSASPTAPRARTLREIVTRPSSRPVSRRISAATVLAPAS